MIADKTKAALQSCQCHYQKLKQNKNTRVNAGGQNFTQLNFEGADFSGFFSQRNSAPTDFPQLLWQSPKVSFAYNSLIPSFFLTLGSKGGISNPTLCLEGFRQATENLAVNYKIFVVQPSGFDLGFLLRWRFFSPFSTLSDSVLVGLLVGAGGCEAGFWGSVMSHPFGSIPSRSRRWRQESLTHELKLPCPATESICLSSASSKRMFFTVLLERSNSRFVFFSCIGIYHRCSVFADGIYHLMLNQVLKTAKPGSARTLTGPLTTNR
ncbi:hypothetical protein [Raoultella ornithinolytica]